jgi:hypothetical protein
MKLLPPFSLRRASGPKSAEPLLLSSPPGTNLINQPHHPTTP